jgi:hypothetical protein
MSMSASAAMRPGTKSGGGGGERERDEQGMENKSAGPGVPDRKTMVKIGIFSRKSSGVHSTRKQPQANRQPVHYSNEKET